MRAKKYINTQNIDVCVCVSVCVAQSLQSCPTLYDPMERSPPVSSVQEHWRGLPCPPTVDLPDPESVSPALQADSLSLNHQGSPYRSIHNDK